MNAWIYWLSAEIWRRPEISIAVQQSLYSLNRLGTGLDRKRERARLKSMIEVIETVALSESSKSIFLSQLQTNEITNDLPRVGQGRLPFCTPSGFGYQTDLKESLALKYGASYGEGFFMDLVPRSLKQKIINNADDIIPTLLFKRRRSSSQSEFDSESEISHGRKVLKLEEKLIRSAETGNPVQIGSARHEKIVNTLREWLHVKSGFSSFKVQFLYRDSSLGGPIQLSSLPERQMPQTGQIFNIGLNSCRHFEIDSKIDIYLLRNAEFKKRDSSLSAEQEMFAYKRMAEFLQNWKCKQGLYINLYHTGLEPIIIGTYRAITDFLLSSGSSESLVVQPVIFSGNKKPPAWW